MSLGGVLAKRFAHGRDPLSAVIARLDRATQYSGPQRLTRNALEYWFPAFAGMTL
jgi:hypothetical protein